MKYIFLALFPAVLVVISFASEGLRLWLGPAFAQNGATALRWLAAGILVNSLAQIPFALIQSAGRPDITAKLHLLELPLYLPAVWFLTKKMGIEGTAIAWSGRLVVEAIIICWCAQSFFEWKGKSLATLGFTTAAGLLLCYAVTLAGNAAIKGLLVLLVLLAFGCAGWFLALAPGERALIAAARKIGQKPADV